MDRAGEWRLIDSDQPEDDDAAEPSNQPAVGAGEPAQAASRWLMALVAMAVVGVAGLAIWLTVPRPDVRLDIGGRVVDVSVEASASASAADGAVASAEPPAQTIVVDVEGAVRQPGLHRLAGDARVGDAIAAAGGYSPSVDIAAAAARLNLAQILHDGDKVEVPILGASSGSGPQPGGDAPTSAGDAASGGLVDVNTASADELDTLPGIGEVTAAKIIAAREEQPFASVEDLAARGVVGPATMDKIRELISVGP